jgi:hypothetical protein
VSVDRLTRRFSVNDSTVQRNPTVALQAHTPDTVSEYPDKEERCNSV